MNELVGHVTNFLVAEGVERTQAEKRAEKLVRQVDRIWGTTGLATLVGLT